VGVVNSFLTMGTKLSTIYQHMKRYVETTAQ
jgi:hypothetical protein